MSAGLHRILHNGPQDERLVGPALPWYQRRLDRTGRYTTQWRRVDFDTTPAFGVKATASIPVAGELLSRIYFISTLPSFGASVAEAVATAQSLNTNFLGPRVGYTNSAGHALVESAELTIGNTAFDRLNSRLLETLDEYYTPIEQVPLVNEMVLRADHGFYPGLYGVGVDETGAPSSETVAVPLPFWCVRGDERTFLPLDALSASRVQVSVQCRSLAGMIATDATPFTISGEVLASAATETGAGTTYGSGGDCTLDVPLYAGNVSGADVSDAAVVGNLAAGNFKLGDTYLMVEYVYVDKLEAYAWRNGLLEYPIVQYTTLPIVQTKGNRFISVEIPFNNPVRNLFFSVQRVDAAAYNMHFQGTRELVRYRDVSSASAPTGLWWPDASGLAYDRPGFLVPGYSQLESEPLVSMELVYEGKYTKTKTLNPALYRSLLPSLEHTKTPWVNRYYYCIPFGLGEDREAGLEAVGEANFNKMTTKRLNLELAQELLPSGLRGPVPNYNVYVHVEGLNVFNVYGGTGSLLFDY